LPSSLLLTETGHMKPRDALTALLTERAIDPSAAHVASCGSGVAAPIIALALAHLGNDLVSVYDGSWTEWASDGDLPIATGYGA